MPKPYDEVDVPIQRTDNPTTRGRHVFVGEAWSRHEAIRIAHEVYETALTASRTGREIPGRRRDGWASRGLRPGWELDWKAATARLWVDSHSWATSGGDAA